ncbi:hypothetical protein ACHAXA_001208 [Cyclostephanos tholiformis]|uniref:Mitochondrial carrier protein n=1 Tax=Cyclostephanos tholiformis TaxID=382380 RepID=A0ABD3SQ12_9STRA
MSRSRLAVVLFFTVHVQLIDGLSVGSARNIIASTNKYEKDLMWIPRPKNNDAVGIPGGVDRRAFFLSAVCAALILAAPENADAAAEASQDPMIHEPASSVDVSMTTSSVYTDSSSSAVEAIDVRAIIERAAKKAMGGGKAGAAAAVVQVFSLMWLRTTMNYQYRFGGTLSSSLKKLYEEGGIPRLYQGLSFALIQVRSRNHIPRIFYRCMPVSSPEILSKGPLTRFGDTAANVGILALLESIPETASLPIPIKTAAGSISAGLWRIVLMPIDTSKTVLQVEGSDGLNRLKERVLERGPAPLYQGALASAAATTAGHFPWFTTYNFLNEKIPQIAKEDDILLFLVRSAVLGLSASSVSDVVSNSLRVIKTTKQTASLGGDGKNEISYKEAIALIIQNDGVLGLLGRGLQTRLLTNAIQGALFSVLWKYFQMNM